MIMMLPFLLAAVAAGLAIMGRRSAGLWLWLLTFIVFLAWLNYHITDALPVSL